MKILILVLVAAVIAALFAGLYFVYKDKGSMASVSRCHAVASIKGLRFSGFIAWWLWRTIYLSKLPRFEKKVRVALDWTLDLLFSKDLVQFLTLRAPAVSHLEEDGQPSRRAAAHSVAAE